MITGEQLKARLSMNAIAVRYGFHPDRNSLIKCPFHSDHDPSLKIYDEPGRGFYCYSCGAGGSIIDFAMRLFRITYKQAVLRLSSDFGYSTVPRDIEAERRFRAEQAQKRREEWLTQAVINLMLAVHCEMHWIIKTCEPMSDIWCWAVKNIDELNYRLEVLQCQTKPEFRSSPAKTS
jgi:hypothetical protein